MTYLDEFLELPESIRRVRLGHKDVCEELKLLGTEVGIAWIERHLESPIGPEWGRLFYELKPDWAYLNRWIRLSKLHCLAAIDALLMHLPNPACNQEREPELPAGGNAILINDAINYALEQYDNPRLQAVGKRIRHAWPVGAPTRHPVNIPEPLEEFALAIFGNDSNLMNEWRDSLATGLNAPRGTFDYWHSLLRFGDRAGVLAIVDWRDSSNSIIERLSNLKSTKGLSVPWNDYARHHSENEVLFREINSLINGFGLSLVSLDTKCDSYALAVVASDGFSILEGLTISAFKDATGIQRFT